MASEWPIWPIGRISATLPGKLLTAFRVSGSGGSERPQKWPFLSSRTEMMQWEFENGATGQIVPKIPILSLVPHSPYKSGVF